MGFPIRKSAGQRLLAPHHSLSQRATSFIASQRQGIPRMLFRRLIVQSKFMHGGNAAAKRCFNRKCSLFSLLDDVSFRPNLRSVGCGGRCSFTMSSRFGAYAPTTGVNARVIVASPLRGPMRHGGARRDRTDDLMLAKHALSQLSYGPDPNALNW